MLRIKSEILRRRQRRRMALQTEGDRRRHIAELFVLLIVLITLHIAALVVFERMAVDDAAWLTLTTVTTVGYGDQVAVTPAGRFATVLLLYIVGIFLLAQIAGEWIDYRFDRRDRMRRGYWRWKMKNHILILNTPDKHGDRYLSMLVEQVRDTPMLQDMGIQIISSHFPEGLPHDIGRQNVVLRSDRPESAIDLSESDIETARFIVLMAVDTNDPRSDSVNLDLLDQIRRYDTNGYIIVECVLESNRERYRKLGANAIIRPIRAYPELLVRTMAAPGTEAILEDLFVYAGNHPRRYDVSFTDQKWGPLASRLLLDGLGTPLGYLNQDQVMVTNPGPEEIVTGRAIFVMVSQNAEYEPDRVVGCLGNG